MKNYATRFALLAVIGGLAVTPAFAAPGDKPDCRDPAMAKNPACLHMRDHKPGGQGGPGGQMPFNNHSNDNSGSGTPTNSGPPPTANDLKVVPDDNGPGHHRRHTGPDSNGPGQNGPGSNGPGKNGPGSNGPGQNGPGQNGAHPPGMGGPGGPGFNFNFSPQDRDQFHRRFRGYDFGFFPQPNFSITPGFRVPHYYDLQPVPRAIWRYYPWFRGYLFFETRRGDIVIVNPRTYRIVAII